MKRPLLFISIFFIGIICSTAVSTAIAVICKSFKHDTEKSISAKVMSADTPLNKGVKQASIKF